MDHNSSCSCIDRADFAREAVFQGTGLFMKSIKVSSMQDSAQIESATGRAKIAFQITEALFNRGSIR